MASNKEDKMNQKDRKPPRKETKKHIPKKTPMETIPVLQKDNENSFDPLTIIKETNFDENIESGKGIVSMNQSNPPARPDPGASYSKERGNQEVIEEDTNFDEEEEEEGEIEMTLTYKKKARGRKSTKEIREEATYKDKLQGSQPTLEKIL